MTNGDSIDDILRADRAGYRARVYQPGDSVNPAEYCVEAGRVILSPFSTLDEAEHVAVQRWQSDEANRDKRAALANAAKSSAAARAKLEAHLRTAVEGLLARFPDAAIDVHDGSVWLVDRRLTLPAIEAELLMRERLDEAFDRYKSAFDEAIDRAGYRVKLSDDEELRRDNLRAEWGDQIVDVLVPVAHPALPMAGRVEVIDGWVVIETATRDDLAQRMGVMFPETIDERVARRQALDEAGQRAQQRANELADQAQRAAEHARAAQ